jgi:hypothetical protein
MDERHRDCGCAFDPEFAKLPGRHVEPFWIVLIMPAVLCVGLALVVFLR